MYIINNYIKKISLNKNIIKRNKNFISCLNCIDHNTCKLKNECYNDKFEYKYHLSLKSANVDYTILRNNMDKKFLFDKIDTNDKKNANDKKSK